MRYDTVVPHLFRVATRDEVIPLTAKVLCRSGSVIEHLPIPRGTQIIISDVAYHRCAIQIPHYILKFTCVLQEQEHMGRRRRYLEAEQMVGRDSPVLRNQSGCMVQFVRHRNTFSPTLSNLVIDCLLAPDNVPVSGGDSRERRKLWTDPWCTYSSSTPDFVGLPRYRGFYSNSFQG